MLDTISSRLKTKEAKAVLVMAAFGFAVMFIEGLMAQHPAYRLALHHAGDIPLPGSTWFQRPSEINYLAIVMGEDGRAAYVQMLSLDNWRVAARLGVLLSIAWLLLTRGIRRAARRLVATALLYAAIDWLENTILHRVFTFNFLPDFIDDWALYITTCKLVVLAAAYTLGVASLLRAFGSAGAWWTAFFHDVPYLLDSIWRRAEFLLNRELDYRPASSTTSHTAKDRRCWTKPAFVFFSLTLLFSAYGPTLDGLCSIAPDFVTGMFPFAAGLLIGWLVIRAAWYLYKASRRAVERRFAPLLKNVPSPALTPIAERREIANAALLVGGIFLLLPAVAGPAALVFPAVREVNVCTGVEFSAPSLICAAIVMMAIILFGIVAQRTRLTSTLIYWQTFLFVGVNIVVWFALSSDANKEADARPYHHVFAALATCTMVFLAFAPTIARLVFNPPWFSGVSPMTRSVFRYIIRFRELFAAREPQFQPEISRVISAAFRSISYRALQLVLLPSLLAFVSPANWVQALTIFGFLLAFLLSTWGNMSTRWRMMRRHVDRWFLHGTAFLVSLFVIVVAGLRIFEVDYVSTILDAAPFGVLFALVLMSYVLSWHVEYWLNRVLAGELLGLLGADPGHPRMPYPLALPPGPGIRVAQFGRELAYHAIGRFLVVGTLTPLKANPIANEDLAFHTYDLLEFFRALAGRNDNHRVAELSRYTSIYFYLVNLGIALILGSFAFGYWHFLNAPPRAIVSADVNRTTNGGADLANRLISVGPQRDAVVVVASGGGTRAALYTSHVLQGLHRLGADRDIALMSGVSGGGVALAYFAAHYRQLSSPTAEADTNWERFRKIISGNVIGDVLQGASEWRILGKTPLTVLLAESLGRNVFGETTHRTMALPDAPPLILNTTITGHPGAESDVLETVLDRAVDGACDEINRPFRIMSGGRLIFTNLTNTSAFPSRDSTIPDTRLPYVVVSDPNVQLADAAALTANFPPVFPNAGVRIPSRSAGCPDQLFYVTDGGAQENLGLVSALFALKGALQDVKRRCERKKTQDCKLKRIHVVLIEASAVEYDYRQDRGISSGLIEAKERLAGGLTQLLINEIQAVQKSIAETGAEIRFHYLPLPLTFRARGGMGTHWMAPGKIELRDPRLRTLPEWWDLSSADHLTKLTLSISEIDEIWTLLHDTQHPFCRITTSDPIKTDAVKRWICGTPYDARSPRDVHIGAWQELVRELHKQPDSP